MSVTAEKSAMSAISRVLSNDCNRSAQNLKGGKKAAEKRRPCGQHWGRLNLLALTWGACGRCRLSQRCPWGTEECSPGPRAGSSAGTSDTPGTVWGNQQSALLCELYLGQPLQVKDGIATTISWYFKVLGNKENRNRLCFYVSSWWYLEEFHLATLDWRGRHRFPWQRWPLSAPPPTACTPASV